MLTLLCKIFGLPSVSVTTWRAVSIPFNRFAAACIWTAGSHWFGCSSCWKHTAFWCKLWGHWGNLLQLSAPLLIVCQKIWINIRLPNSWWDSNPWPGVRWNPTKCAMLSLLRTLSLSHSISYYFVFLCPVNQLKHYRSKIESLFSCWTWWSI